MTTNNFANTMTRWKATIEYDGSLFCGWQRQAHAFSVQEALEDSLLKLSGENIVVHAAGRTDAGVHAAGQVVHFDLLKPLKAHNIREAVNFYLKPNKAAITEIEPAAATFHARFDALKRHYKYFILNRRAPPALLAGKVWHVPQILNITPMQEAAQILIGKHDFSTFRAADCQANSPIRTLERLSISCENDQICFEVTAKSFLYHQVRNMVGTLAQVGKNKWSVKDFEAAFLAANRTKGGPTAPPQGLYFWKVDYNETV